ncbi:DUF982 domain-containing protein [Rhizobium halophilum]|uniref:DUF982 domain-containing protein n=1 Tax=Rhizobium halophilum TaxID=2846852 RepID=UPI001EFEC5BF|nr:DUF982 domain-containing protein [Rhizobium halophilum]MCF6371084.1 DUF982 domain-containing protein [Rhizobium halophilum]
MQTNIWDNQIEIICDGGDHFKRVCSPRDAVACLTNHWPDQRGRAYAAAKRACLKAIKGEVALSIAEAAFVKAAEEAGILKH